MKIGRERRIQGEIEVRERERDVEIKIGGEGGREGGRYDKTIAYQVQRTAEAESGPCIADHAYARDV